MLRTREQLEDTIQKCVCQLLPKMPPQDIRPAYQQRDMAGKAYETDSQNYEYRGFSPNDNFIYIQVKIGSEPIGPYVSETGTVQITNLLQAKFIFYGPNSYQLALCLYSLLATEGALSYFETENLYISNKSENIDELRELVNEQWFERHEFTLNLYESLDIKTPAQLKVVPAESTNIKVIAYEDNEKIGEHTL